MVVARKGSPLIVGIGNGEYIVASDGSAIISHTAQAMTLDDYSVARLTRDGLRTSTIDNMELTPKVMQLELELDEIELGGFEHYMRKEIYEQPRALRRTIGGRLDTTRAASCWAGSRRTPRSSSARGGSSSAARARRCTRA
jgi:glucosamine--fructose-6-phosphate aminotransferase (isomerizing)